MEQLILGQSLWSEANKKLPKAYGILEDDVPRIKAFAQHVSTLTETERYAMHEWLEHEIHEWDGYFGEIATGLEEQYERRQLQIYRQHIAVLEGKKYP